MSFVLFNAYIWLEPALLPTDLQHVLCIKGGEGRLAPRETYQQVDSGSWSNLRIHLLLLLSHALRLLGAVGAVSVLEVHTPLSSLLKWYFTVSIWIRDHIGTKSKTNRRHSWILN